MLHQLVAVFRVLLQLATSTKLVLMETKMWVKYEKSYVAEAKNARRTFQASVTGAGTVTLDIDEISGGYVLYVYFLML